ncbi:hypothetical protein SH1V18_03530 [Vallitalea longa]|uniref:Uncharacterized protein n=1 Tax=Vallitalea longa TaxID=2936439 RepID=A0A9W6DE01_9FIRM|nr:hypothetical protein [Vallitalea longa]GKX27873.1 hypothetical protein SH1V18_03530 [Vallitalea longa]
MDTNPLYYIGLYCVLFAMIATACVGTVWNLIKMYFENKKNKQVLVFLQDYIRGKITDKELVNNLLLLYPGKGDKLISTIPINKKEATALIIALDQIVDKHKSDDIKRLEYKLWCFVNKEKASYATADKK